MVARTDLAQPLGHLGSCGDVRQGGAGLLVPQLGREPDLQVQGQSGFGGEPETLDVAAADLDGVALQVVPDDLQLAAYHRGIEDRTPVDPKLPAYAVENTPASHDRGLSAPTSTIFWIA